MRGITGEFTQRIAATSDPREIGVRDLAIVLVDTNGTRAAAEVARDTLAPDGYALTLQNGVGNLETLAAMLGPERVVGGLSYHSAALVAPGVVDHTHAGPTWIGETDGRRTRRIEALAALLEESGFRPQIVDNMVGYIWGKFIHNCAINAVSAITGMRCGEIVSNPATDAFQSYILEEVIAVVRKKGIVVPESDPFVAVKDFCRVKFNKPSMLQHIEEGRQTEIDSLNGVVVREGRAAGIPTPYNEALTLLIKGREAVMRQILHGEPLDYDRLEREAKAS
jgi:2-dehydropantoate 2-reductase